MLNQELERDQLYRVLAIQLGLLDATRLEQFSKDSDESGVSFAYLILERAGLSDHDQQGLRWLVERTLATQQVATNHGSIESTGATGLQTPQLPGESKFLSTIIKPLPQRSIIVSATPPSKPALTATATSGIMSSADRYVEKRFHAKGGIGQVWLARDLNFGREVALKELLPERRDELSERRFLIEAKVTGQLEHPGIVPVYDLHTEGTTGAFYTMRFIQGRTLRDEIREFHGKKDTGQSRSLGQANLLNSFIAICNTIEYAHSRGVIHRDLKGQNVAIGEFGEVIVLDWGLAKVWHEGEAEANATHVLRDSSSESTHDGAIIGTPAFMSPEQAIGQNDRVGPRSDIYSLGVMLYEILTGQTPFKSDDLRDLLKQVVSAPPLPPTKIAATVPKSLEAVCLKALAKRPEDRYGSARELADEVRRFLADEPVEARPDSIAMRAARWGRRHRTTVISAASILVMLVIGLTTGAALLANANQKINDQRIVAQKNAEQANINFTEALSTVNNFFTVISENRLLNVPGMAPLRDELLQNAADYYTRFASQDAENPELQVNLADTHIRIARIRMMLGRDDEAREELQKAMTIHDRMTASGTGDALGPVKYAGIIVGFATLEKKQGNSRDAQSQYQKAIEVLEQHTKKFPGDEEAINQLAQYYSIYSNYLYQTSSVSDATASITKSIDLSRSLVAAKPDAAAFQLALAESLAFQAILLRDSRDAQNADPVFREAIEIFERVRGKVRNTGQLRASLAACLQSYGTFLRITRQTDLANETLRKAIDLREELVREFPTVPEYRSALGLSDTSLGVLLLDNQELDEALKYYGLAAALHERLAEDFPDVPNYQDDLASSHNNMAIVYRMQEQYDKALAAYQKCIDVRLKLLEKTPDSVYTAAELGNCYRNIGRLSEAQGDREQALAWQDKSISLLAQLVERIGNDPRVRNHLCRAHWDRAESLEALQRYAESAEAWQKAAECDDRGERDFIAMQRARALALAGDVSQATQEAERLMKIKTLDGETRFNAACVFALAIKALDDNTGLTAEERTTQRQPLEEHAMAALKRADEAGFFDDEDGQYTLREKADLAPIRGLEPFQQMLKKLPQY